MILNARVTALPVTPWARGVARRRYLPGGSLWRCTRPVKWILLRPVLSLWEKLPTTTKRVHARPWRLRAEGLRQLLPWRRPAAGFNTLKVVLDAWLSVNVMFVPVLLLAAVLPPEPAARKVEGLSRSRLSAGFANGVVKVASLPAAVSSPLAT